MPIEMNNILSTEEKIIQILKNEKSHGRAVSSKELAEIINIGNSTARKYLKHMFDEGILDRGKKYGGNKTYYYYYVGE